MNKLIVITMATFIAVPQAFAGVQEFEDEERPLWFDAVGDGNYTTIHFDELPNNTTVTDQYEPHGLTFSGLNFITMDESDEDGWALRIFDGNDLYFDEPINWIAADIRGSIMVELFVGDTKFYTSQSFGAGPTPHFGGLISEQGFDHIRIYDRFDNLAILQDFYFGPAIAVPAPASFIAVVSPLFLMPRRRR